VSTRLSRRFPLDRLATAPQSAAVKRGLAVAGICLLAACARQPDQQAVRRSEAELAAGKSDAALRVVVQALAETPDSLLLLRQLVIVLLEAEQLPAVREVLNKLPPGDPVMTRALRHPNNSVRTQAAKLIAETPALVPPRAVLRGMDDVVPEVRSACARAAGKQRDRAALKGLFRLLNDPNWSVRADAADALAQVGDPRAVGWLIYRLRDADGFVRYRTATALHTLACAENQATLRQALTMRGLRQELDVAVALAKLGDAAALGPLTNSLNGVDSETRRRAIKALEELTKTAQGEVRTLAEQALQTAAR